MVFEFAGDYGRRQSHIVSFVNPDILGVNVVPNAIFHGHSNDLESLHLVPVGSRSSVAPFALHWAGLGASHNRYALMEKWLKSNYGVTPLGCPERAKGIGRRSFGSNGRKFQCCNWLFDRWKSHGEDQNGL